MAVSGVVAQNKSQSTRDQAGRPHLLLLLAINNADKAAGSPDALAERLGMMWAFAGDVKRSLLEYENGEDGSDEAELGNDVDIDVALTTLPYFHQKSAAIADAEFYKRHAKNETDNGSSPEQVVLAGYDTLIRLFNPKYYGAPTDGDTETPIRKALDPFFSKAMLRVTMRTGAEWGGKSDQMAYVEDVLHGDALQKLGGNKAWAQRIELVEGRADNEDVVSSTLARDAAKSNDWELLKRLVPASVASWVQDEKLYS
jgi:nicotinamide-nucleotide adenylyltransferase